MHRAFKNADKNVRRYYTIMLFSEKCRQAALFVVQLVRIVCKSSQEQALDPQIIHHLRTAEHFHSHRPYLMPYVQRHTFDHQVK